MEFVQGILPPVDTAQLQRERIHQRVAPRILVELENFLGEVAADVPMALSFIVIVCWRNLLVYEPLSSQKLEPLRGVHSKHLVA